MRRVGGGGGWERGSARTGAPPITLASASRDEGGVEDGMPRSTGSRMARAPRYIRDCVGTGRKFARMEYEGVHEPMHRQSGALPGTRLEGKKGY
jgi:hypothetical protein